MKTKLLLTLLLFTALQITAYSQAPETPANETENPLPDKDPETVVIKTLESNSFGVLNNVESRMIIVDNNNGVEIKELKRVNFSMDGNEGIEFNTKALKQELQRWHARGYMVKSTSTVAPKEYIVITTIILQKN